MLHIAPVELCDSGQVTCVACTGMSGDGECVARTELSVRDDGEMYDEEGSCSLQEGSCCVQAEDVAPAMLIRGPSDTTALRGDRVVLKATYVGVPQPVVRWLKAVSTLTFWQLLLQMWRVAVMVTEFWLPGVDILQAFGNSVTMQQSPS
jgi:hypothetical protein